MPDERAAAAPGVMPLAAWADAQLAAMSRLAPGSPLGDLSGATLLGERAALNGFVVPGRVSAGGGCRLLRARDGDIALNLARPADRDLLPALFGDAAVDPANHAGLAARVADSGAAALVARGRELGLAIADVAETPASPAVARITQGLPAVGVSARPPRVVDLAALWAGPLAAHLLGLAGAQVIKVESRSRPDAMRHGDPALFARVNGGKDSVVIDLRAPDGGAALVRLLRRAEIVVESARPRALQQLGIDADALVREVPGLVWVSITGHGIAGQAGTWVGFGDDCAVAGGLAAALASASGASGFVGDAIADPLTGLAAALAALAQRRRGTGGRLVLAMSAVAAEALAWERARDPAALDRALQAWAAATGQPFAPIAPRRAAAVHPLGADTGRWLAPS